MPLSSDGHLSGFPEEGACATLLSTVLIQETVPGESRFSTVSEHRPELKGLGRVS